MRKPIIFITGASSGIGAATAVRFAAEGYRVVLNGRNRERLAEVRRSLALPDDDVREVVFDVRDREAAKRELDALPDEWREVDILVNNAGLALGLDKVHEGDLADWDTMIDTNVASLLYITRLILPGMVERGRGHIINISSTAGEGAYARGAVYCATKAAVNVISEGLRIDLVDTPVRVTNVMPGLADTGFSTTRFHGDKAKADAVYSGMRPMTGDDVAGVILYAASVPPHIQIAEIMVMPTCQATGAVVHRNND